MRWLSALILVLLAAPALAADPDRAVREVLSAESLQGAHVGFVLVDLPSGKTVVDINGAHRFTPASIQKLYTAAAALRLLGPEHRYRTRVNLIGYVGLPPSHVNTLVVKPSGDPSLGLADLEAMARQVRAAGVRSSEDLQVDLGTSPFPPLGTGWAWDDESFDYSAQLGPFSVSANTVGVSVRPALAPGVPPVVRSSAGEYIEIVNEARTVSAGSEDTLRILRERGRNVVRVWGEIPAGQAIEERVTVERPAEHATFLFDRALEAAGIRVLRNPFAQGLQRDWPFPPAPVRASVGRPGPRRPLPPKVVARHDSPPLRELLTHMVKQSDNFYAEQILRSFGGAAEAKESLRQVGLDPSQYRMVDGSGLSRYNLLTPAETVKLLVAMRDDPHFVSALPIAARDGTLRNRLHALEGRVLAKTGTMSNVSSLAGYVLAPDHTPRYAFCFISNGHLKSIKPLEDRLLAAIASHLDSGE